MLYLYAQCIEIFGIDRKLKQIYIIEKGIYSNKEDVSDLSIISMKYSNAIFTLNSAFYYHRLTDIIPDLYFLSIPKDTKKYLIKE